MPSSTLRSLKNHLELEPGVHWLYSTGKKNSPILWNVPAIREWQIEKTVLEIRSTDAKRQEEAAGEFEGVVQGQHREHAVIGCQGKEP